MRLKLLVHKVWRCGSFTLDSLFWYVKSLGDGFIFKHILLEFLRHQFFLNENAMPYTIFFVCLPMIWIDCFFFDLVFFFFENVKTLIKLWSEGKSDSQQLLLFLVCRTSASFWVSLMWENNEFCISALGTRSERKYLVSMSILLLEFMLVLLML